MTERVDCRQGRERRDAARDDGLGDAFTWRLGPSALAVCLLCAVAVASCFSDFNQAVPCENDAQCTGGLVCDVVVRRCVKDGQQIRPPSPDADGSDSDGEGDVSGLPNGDTSDGPGTGDGTDCDPGVEDCSEPCDGFFEDDDCVCDSRYRECVTEPCSEGMALVERESPEGEDFSFCIDAFEASRADATEGSAGEDDASAPLSRPGVLPWMNVTFEEAEDLCETAGKRLCTVAEWRAACEGPERNLWPYGNFVERNACNGLGFRAGTEFPVPETTIPTGTEPECESGWGVFDMAGNAAEWVQQRHTAGGYHRTSPTQMTCSFVTLSPEDPPAEVIETMGFRCCREPR